MSIEYNHDLDVSEDFLRSFTDIKGALKDQRAIDELNRYDLQAKFHKRAFHNIGLLSLIFAVITLVAAAIEMLIGGSVVHRTGIIGLVAQSGSVISVLLILWNRLAGHRLRWCQAVFCRERIRQWHFQTFLDGQLICLFKSNPTAFKNELDRRWGTFQQNLRDGYGLMSAFIRQQSLADDFFHQQFSYSNAETGKLVVQAMETLRFEHQLRYTRRRLAPAADDGSIALEERNSFSESLASTSLAGAVAVGALGFFVAIREYSGTKILWTKDIEVIVRYLSGTALLLAVISAASRAYRAGITVPDEIESYDEYADRIHELKAIFDNASTIDDKLKQLHHLETESIAELRRFLRMKLRATFIF